MVGTVVLFRNSKEEKTGRITLLIAKLSGPCRVVLKPGPHKKCRLK